MDDKFFVIIPSLNPDEKLINTVNGMINIGFKNILIVNDGSDSEHLKYFPSNSNNITILHHKQNLGKGAALKTAFRYILENHSNASGVITVDGDGQHTPKDAIACANAVLKEDNSIVLGCRNFSYDNVPLRSRMGNNITSFIFKTLCGIKISDTQTGLRAFSVKTLPLLIKIKGERFEYETNMLLKLKQYGIRFKEIPIETVYLEENATSHFRPFVDSLKIYRFILSYFFSAGISFIVDISLFYIICKFFGGIFGTITTLAATVIARAFSSVINYYINRSKVFDCNTNKRKSFIRYYMLAIPQMLISAGLVSLLSSLLSSVPFLKTLIKIIVDTLLFFISYRIQQNWVFSVNDNKKET